MRTRAGWLGILLLAWLTSTGAVGACHLFRPAVPEQGGVGGSVPTDYRDPDSTLKTLALALEDKGRRNGLSAYLAGLADSATDGRAFRAFFDPAVLARFQAGQIPPVWDATYERNFYNNFTTFRTGEYGVHWFPDDPNPDQIETDRATLHRRLEIYERTDSGDSLLISVGFADLDFIRSTRWVITRWQDRVDPTRGANPRNPDEVSYGFRRLERQ